MKPEIKFGELFMENHSVYRRYQHIWLWIFMILVCSVYAFVIQYTLIHSGKMSTFSRSSLDFKSNKQTMLLSINKYVRNHSQNLTNNISLEVNYSSSNITNTTATTTTYYYDDEFYDEHDDEIWNMSDIIYYQGKR